MPTINFHSDKNPLIFNFEGGSYAYSFDVQNITSFKEYQDFIKNIRVTSLKKVPIYYIYKGKKPSTGTGELVGSYLLDDNEEKERLLSTVGSLSSIVQGVDYYIENSEKKQDVQEDLNNIKYPSTEFYEEIFFSVTTPKTRNDDSPNLIFKIQENKDKNKYKETDIRIYYSDNNYIVDRVLQNSYIAEMYIIPVRKGTEVSYDTSTGVPYNVVLKGSPITQSYLRQGKRVINQNINNSTISKVKLDRRGFEIRTGGWDGKLLIRTEIPEEVLNYNKILATVSYEGCSTCTTEFSNAEISYEDASDLEQLLKNKYGVVVFRNKTKENLTINNNIYAPEDSIVFSSPGTCTYNIEILSSINGVGAYSSGGTIYQNSFTLYDIYPGCAWDPTINGYPTPQNVFGEASNTGNAYSTEAKIPVQSVTNVPPVIKIPTTSDPNELYDAVFNMTAVHSNSCACFCSIYGGNCSLDLESEHYDPDLSQGSLPYNISVEAIARVCDASHDINDFSYLYVENTFYNDHSCLEISEQSGSCVTTNPTAAFFLSNEFNDSGNTENEGSGCSCNGGSSGCGYNRIMIGSTEIQRVYVGDNIVESIFIGDNKYYSFSYNDLRPANEE